MVDNEKAALDHYGLAEADAVYGIMNSTANGRITRLMAAVKDWERLHGSEASGARACLKFV